MKKILVIGSKGMAGHAVFSYFKSKHIYEVYGMARNVENNRFTFNLDISQTKSLENIVVENKFDIIVNCIGILNKDAEQNPEKAIWFNSYFPHFLESITKNSKTRIIHISTDCVFSGDKGNYTEHDLKDGKGFYAQSKALGELINEKDTTIRTSIIGPELSSNGIGLLNWFLNQPDQTSLKGFSNAFWTGLTTLELAKVIEQIAEQHCTGLIQVVPKDKINKFNLITLFNKVFRNDILRIDKDENYKVDKSLKSIRRDFNYEVPSYEKMLLDQKEWMLANSDLYKHYSI
jgi:dTDP-4-dehydrorhamnose reductase